MSEQQQTTETGPEGTPPESGNAEAAKWRTKLRETEGERDTLTGRVQAMQTAEAERLAGEHLKKATGLWAAGAKLEDLLGEDGNVDAGKVKAAALSAADPARLGAAEAGRPRARRGTQRPAGREEVVLGRVQDQHQPVRGQLTVRWLQRAWCPRHLAVAPGGHPLVGPGAPAFDPVSPS